MNKIVYFDEESATDYLQITQGGKLEKTAELLRETSKNASAQGGLNADSSTGKGVFSSLLGTLIGFNASANIGISGGVESQTDKIAKSIIQNTILTDFINLISKKDTENEDLPIKVFREYELTIEKDSLTYMVSVSPFMSMLKGDSKIDNELDLAIDKVDETIRNAKGYYELVGNSSIDTPSEKKVFRFNINALKNNYKISDLKMMDLAIYAIKVGTIESDNLKFQNAFETSTKKTNPKFNPSSTSSTENPDTPIIEVYDVYDVLLAGVE